ncbi:MAG: hypothetical protein ABI181_06765 [Mycobacteriaceae bacterium]
MSAVSGPELALRRTSGSSPSTRVTVESQVGETDTTAFWALYLRAFEPLRTRAAARNVLHHEEFVEEMNDARVQKYVAWDHEGHAVGLTTLTDDLAAVPWVSPEYYAAQFPEHAARGALYYLGFTLVHPRARRGSAFTDMMQPLLSRLVRERAVVCSDVCAFNNAAHGFEGNVIAMLTNAAEVDVEVLDTQTYYSARFQAPRRR